MEECGVKCQCCPNAATVHLTDIVNGHMKETHLCQGCAEKKQLLLKQELNLSAILQSVIGPHIGQVTDDLARLTCPQCGIKYMEFKAEGRLGCPHDYQVFHAALEPLLHRIHRATRHAGKQPRHRRRNTAWHAEVVSLRQQLREAVETEKYEEAARLRDLLRQKEATDEPG
jgi:protein arginine kinase activator